MKSFTSIIAILACASAAVAAPAATPAVASVTPGQTPAVDGTYAATVLKHHNVHRANHSSPALQWGPYMAAWALQLASRCSFGHNTSIGFKPYGQNIAAGTQAHDISYIVSDQFYDSEVNWYNGQYGKVNPDFTNFEHWGHFSQLVWKGTTNVGCATVDCSKTGIAGLEGMNIAPYMTVCNYWPAGNMGGEYGANIGSPLNNPTITGNY